MLISHLYRFIFIKTVKTAGTSVEAFFEPYCCPPGHVVEHWTPTLISNYGVVGRRWPQNNLDDYGFYNHMPASEIKARCPFFDQYTRFTTVRNPYDRAISYFHFRHETFQPPGGLALDDAITLLDSGHGDELRDRFVFFLEHGLPNEQALLSIQGELAVQHWIRYEHLAQDVQSVLRHLGIPESDSFRRQLPTFKVNRHGRSDIPPITAYLSQRALSLIHQQCAWSFHHFGYEELSLHDLP